MLMCVRTTTRAMNTRPVFFPLPLTFNNWKKRPGDEANIVHVQEKDGGTLQRNQRDLVLMPRSTGSQLRDEPENTDETNEQVTNNGNGQRTNENEIEDEVRTRSGRVSKPPQKYM